MESKDQLGSTSYCSMLRVSNVLLPYRSIIHCLFSPSRPVAAEREEKRLVKGEPFLHLFSSSLFSSLFFSSFQKNESRERDRVSTDVDVSLFVADRSARGSAGSRMLSATRRNSVGSQSRREEWTGEYSAPGKASRCEPRRKEERNFGNDSANWPSGPETAAAAAIRYAICDHESSEPTATARTESCETMNRSELEEEHGVSD